MAEEILNPAQIQLESDLQKVPTIQSLREGLQNLNKGQTVIAEKIESERELNKKEFAKGAEKFDKIETKLAELEDTMNNGLGMINASIVNLKSELKDERINKLTNQIEKRDSKDEDSKKTKVLFIQAIAVMVLSVAFTALFANIPAVTVG